MADKRVSISLAALLVKVTANTPDGAHCPLCNNQAMRVVNTRVLPDPAPAKISACSRGNATAARCSALRPCSRAESGGGRDGGPDVDPVKRDIQGL
jgi:hypothetical protein